MKYELLVLDIDGTVTNSEKKVLPKTREAIIRAQKKGVKVVLASGRPPEGVYPIAEELKLERYGGSYILAFNGGRIMDFRTRKCVFEKQIPRHIPGRLWREAAPYGVGVAVYKEGAIVAATDPDDFMKMESKVSGLPIEIRGSFGQYLEFPVNECLITGDPEILETIEPMLARQHMHEAQVFHSEPFYLEVTPKNVNKAYGLKHLLKLLDIPREKMLCCGDSYNDIAMLQYAGKGVAMANGVEEVKMIADVVTENDNDHDGIAEVIDRFFPEA